MFDRKLLFFYHSHDEKNEYLNIFFIPATMLPFVDFSEL
jgi:hypothetical protein